jgi:sugar/nucleoside kinase (ribokinase family)/fructoselysine-6-P-deglycase FrlB-like protein
MMGSAGQGREAGGPRVIVVGNLTLDDVVLPDGTARMACVGGNSLYASLAARLWEARVGIVTRRGEDFPAGRLERLRDLGIDTAGVTAISGPTVRNWVIYEADGRRTFVYRTAPRRSLEVAVAPEDLPDSWLASEPAPVVHVAAMPLAAAEGIVARVRERADGAVITLDTHEDWVAGYSDRLLALAATVDAFIPSRFELADLVGYDDPMQALAELAALPTPVIVIKLGAKGCLVSGRALERAVSVGISAGPVVDTTGAGDAFCGGFAAGLASGRVPVEAARLGAVSAGFAVGGFSSVRLSEITPQDARARLTAAAPVATAVPASAQGISPGRAGAGRLPEDPRDISVMKKEIITIPTTISNFLAGGHAATQPIADSLAHDGIEHVYLVGCGDSYFAGIGACLAFAKHTGVDVHAVPAMEMARYRVRYLPPGSAVVCISYSGKVGRTIEAATQARAFGHRVIALTGHADSPLSREAGECLLAEVPTLGYSPGTTTYVAMQTALYDLALRWGRARGASVDGARELLAATPDLARAAMSLAESATAEVAARIAHRQWVSLIGAGPHEASARFGAAKLVEGARILGASSDLEEWAHEEYFCSGKATPVVVIAPSGAATDRAAEILSELTFIGADAIFLSDHAPGDPAVTHVPLPRGVAEEFAPVVSAVPLSLLGCLVAAAAGKRSYNFPSQEAEAEHYETIHRATSGVPA